jgi:hypothetical protein
LGLFKNYRQISLCQFQEEHPEIEETELSESDVTFEVTNWNELEDFENIHKLLEELADYNGNLEIEIISAGIDCGIDLSNIDEAYSGHFITDEDFAEETAEQLGAIDRNVSWPMNCIDWNCAAKELMYDYLENNGYYFRNF